VLRLLLHHHAYRSHAISAAALKHACAPFVTFVQDPAEAQVALLYGSAYHVPRWLQQMPQLHHVYRIGHFVWEADRLAPEQLAGVQLVDEIWTPSAYCQKIFAQYHPNVVRVPHVVPTAPAVSAEARRAATTLWQDANAESLRLLSIGTDDLRKNYSTLIAAFAQLRQSFAQATMLLKHNPTDTPSNKNDPPGVTRLYTDLPSDSVDALYAAADIYVSAHHSEGWGLTLSQAMARGVLTVAPHYSGNLDFMAPDNSVLVPAEVAPIGPNLMPHWFNPDMQWGHPTAEAMATGLHQACGLVTTGQNAPLLARARASVARFAPMHVAAQLGQMWPRIAARVLGG
jgi:glycosyltransferase involved in cell wall biosynthesis